MPKYKVFVNGERQGSITCKDVESFVQETYPGVKHEVDHDEREVYLQIGMLEAMRLANSALKMKEEIRCKEF